MKTLKIYLLGISCLTIFSCQEHSTKNINDLDCKSIMELNNILAKAVVQDGFSPPVASRIYAYPNIAAYESLCLLNKDYKSFAGQLNELDSLSITDDLTEVDPEILVITVFSEVARKLVYTYQIIDKGRDSLLQVYSGKTDMEQTRMIGNKMAQHINDWIKKDHYKETRSMPMQPVTHNPAAWQPTPPTFGEAVEPHWNKIRPFTLKSADQFKPEPPVEFSVDSNSAFYKIAYEVYNAGRTLSDSLQFVAKFWDCNPMPTTQIGHMIYVRRQLSPGGHWIKITQNVCQKAQLDLLESTRILSLVSIAIADGFISAWDEKYRSNLIRPETYINKYIDKDWKPLLQTPMFPEHTSAHSVISSAAATVLTHVFGDNFSFVDNAEEFIGLEPRKFNSFREAANMAAMSRFYGGIHYKPAIEYGKEQGNKIGEWVWNQIDVNHQK